ncbi:MAG: tRNA lysidine(34) synthetase TilS [Hyphomonadaceae bacterium]
MLDRLTIERIGGEAGPILIGLSGGGDSAALLHLLIGEFGAARLHAAIVDHCMREGSPARAEAALQIARDAGVSAALLRPEGSPPSASQEHARRLRYTLLCAHARTRGARVIALAHTADDQAETVFMRAASGSGWRGLAGMAALDAAPLWPEGRGLLLARPLLSGRRAALRAWLRERGAHWIEDPANEDAHYERVRVRARLAALEAEGLDPMRLARAAPKLRALAETVDAAARALIASAVSFAEQEIVLDCAAWRGGGSARRRALSVLIAAAAGAAQTPEVEAAARLEVQIGTAAFRGASLGGATLTPRRGKIHIGRDAGAVTGRAGVPPLEPLALAERVEIVWDGRLALTATAPDCVLMPGAAPQVAQAGRVVALAEAAATGLVRARWLMEQHVKHRLGPV